MSTGADGDVLHWTDGVNPTLVSQAQRAADQHQGRGVVVQDASGIIVAANDGTAGAATSVLGLSWDQLVGRTSRDRHWSSVSEQGLAIPGDQHPAMRTLTTGEPIRGFLMGVFTPGALTRKGLILGRTRWLEISSIPIDPTSGETPVSEAGLAGVVTIFEDVSDTPRGRAASDSLLSYYQLMGEAAFDAMVRTDMDAIISWASDSLWWVLGRDPVAEVGQSVLSWVHPGDSAAIRALISETIADSKHLPAEVRITGSNGEHRWMSVHARGLRDGRDTIVGAVLGLRDIDQQVRSQLATRAAELRFELVADSAADFSFTADRDGRATWVSRSVSKNFGWTPDDLLGTQIADLVHPDDAADVTDYRKQLSSGLAVSPKTTDAVVRMRTKTGQYRWVTGRAEPLVDDDGATTGIVANLRDVGDLVRAQEAVRESEARFRLLAENASDVVWQVSLGNITRWVSPSVEPTLGWRPDELIGTRTFDLIHPDDREMLRGSRTERLSGAPLPSMELRLRTADGSYRWMSLQARVITDDKGSAEDVILWLRDVNQEVEARDALQASEARYRLLAENASDVVWQVDPGGHLAWCSESVTSVLGWSREQIVGKIATDLMHPEDRDRALNARAEVLAGGTAHGETRVLCADGSSRWMAVDAHPIIGEEALSEVVTLRDIQDEVTSREQLRHALEHDPLTGLATQPTIVKRLDRLLTLVGAPGQGAAIAVLCVGVDHLSAVNEALTHAAGDRVLTAVAARIATVADTPDQIARGTGDEFVIIIPDLVRAADAGMVAEQVRQAAKGTLFIRDQELQPTVSIGIATGGRGASGSELVRDASLAMRQAKADGRDRWEFSDNRLAVEARRRLTIEAGIRDGLNEGQFAPWFQPIVDLSSRAVVGYEALMRWVQSDGTVVEPGGFLPIAERTHLVADLDLVALWRSTELLARLPASQHVAVNVSVTTLNGLACADNVKAALTACGVEPSRLHLEVTETALLTVNDHVRAVMHELAGAGVRWYVDDFGTGYSTIAHLRDLPFAGLKLDGSFTAGVGAGDLTCERLTKGLIGLADGLGLDTVAERIETSSEAAIMRAQGWRHGQGWLYGHPVPGAALTTE